MHAHRLLTRLVPLALGAAALAAGSGARAPVAQAQERTLRFERTVDFTPGKTIVLNARVGEVRVQSVEFTDRGRPSSGVLGGLRGVAVPETSTVLRAHFVVENPTADEWEVAFTIELLDQSGTFIDRASKKSSWEGESNPLDIDHPILRYAVPHIAQVRIRLDARLD
jgi:hypothetical protein